MLKVLYLINHAGKAGTERYVYSLMKRLHGSKIEAHFAYNEEGLLVEWVKDLGITPKRIVMKSPLDIPAANVVKTYCEENGISIIHTQYLRENYISMLSKLVRKGTKVFYTNHFVMEKSKPLKYANKLFNRLQDQVIAVCNIGREMLIENGVDSKKIQVIFNGVDVNYWGEPVESTIRSELGISDEEFVFLCGSRFAHDKGHKYLIKAVAELKKITNNPFRCVLSNDGPLLAECKELVKELALEGEVIFTGYRKDVKNLIYGADLYVNSSEHEALSFAIIEVLACRTPVIATNMAGNGDIINADTNCGVLVEYNNETMLAQTIKGLMEDKVKLEMFKENAYKTAVERFNLDKMIEKTYNLYELIIKEKK